MKTTSSPSTPTSLFLSSLLSSLFSSLLSSTLLSSTPSSLKAFSLLFFSFCTQDSGVFAVYIYGGSYAPINTSTAPFLFSSISSLSSLCSLLIFLISLFSPIFKAGRRRVYCVYLRHERLQRHPNEHYLLPAQHVHCGRRRRFGIHVSLLYSLRYSLCPCYLSLSSGTLLPPPLSFLPFFLFFFLKLFLSLAHVS
jgi:hypothetical protein